MTLIYTTASFLTAPVWARIARAQHQRALLLCEQHQRVLLLCEQHQRVLLLCEFDLYLLAYVEVNLDFSVNGQNGMCDSWKDFDGTKFSHRIGN